MNILVLCHDYYKHELLTLVTERDYIYLTSANIRNISSLTNGEIEKIIFLDTLAQMEDDIQKQNVDQLEDGFFDVICTIHCPPFFSVPEMYGSKLTNSGKIVDIKVNYSKKRVVDMQDNLFFPFIVKPLSSYHETSFGRTVHMLTVFDKSTNQNQIKNVNIQVNRDLLPVQDVNGIIEYKEKNGKVVQFVPLGGIRRVKKRPASKKRHQSKRAKKTLRKKQYK